MAKKRKKESTPPAEPQFRTSSFAALKAVQIEKELPEAPPPPKPAAVKTVKNDLPEELFMQAMAGVRPLDGIQTVKKKKQAIKSPENPATPQPYQRPALPREEVVARKTFLKEVEKLRLDVRFEDSIPEEEELKPLSGNRLRQLKRGIVELDRQLDLHGLTRDEAIDALQEFLEAASRVGEKAVLVITGRGNRSAGPPVLQQSVAGWLREQGRSMVAEYAPAPKEFGGEGAFVVFLRPLDKPAGE